MNDQYRQGFVQQCAARGVDPGWLVKQSQGVLDMMSGAGKLTGRYQGPAPSLKAIPQGTLDSPFPSRGSNNPRSPGPLPPPTAMPQYNADREAAYQRYMKSAPQRAGQDRFNQLRGSPTNNPVAPATPGGSGQTPTT